MNKSFGKRINKVRKEKGITSEALAAICEVNPVFIRQIEGGMRTPSLPVFVKICNALKTSPDYFLKDELTNMESKDEKEQMEQKLSKFTKKELDTIGRMIQVFDDFFYG